jgi:thiamine biosynthesis lipoprotein
MLASGCAEPRRAEREWTAMGRTASAEVWTTTEKTGGELLDAIVEAVARAERTLGTAEESELSRLNAEAPLGAYRVDDQDLYRCIRLALDYAKTSEGAYDPTVGPLTALWSAATPPRAEAIERARESVGWVGVVTEREAVAVRFRDPGIVLDLGGVAPGYVVDVAARNFALPGSIGGTIRIGDHVYTWGRRGDGSAWEVTLGDPRATAGELGTVRVATRGIAWASGEVETILDPRTGSPTTSNVVVAVAFADSGADADAISTALVVAGSRRAGKLLSELRHVEAILLVREPDSAFLLVSSSLEERFAPSAALLTEVGGDLRFLLPPAAVR